MAKANWKEKALDAYMRERFKQTMPYQYEVAIQDQTRGVHTGGPLVSALGNVVYFPDSDRNILDLGYTFAEYTIFIHSNGMPEEDLVSRLLAESNGADIIYPDEDFLDFFEDEAPEYAEDISNVSFRTPWRKPDYSPDTLMSFPYIETCFAVRTEFARSVYDPTEDMGYCDEVRIYDFLLKCMRMTDKITHVQEVLYHRFLPEELREFPEDSQVTDELIYEALYKRYNKPEYCIVRDAARTILGYDDVPEPDETDPVISVIIPSKDHSELLKTCIDKVVEAKDDLRIEIIVVDNGSGDEEKEQIEKYLDSVVGARTYYLYESAEFNFSAMCNTGAQKAKGQYLLFLNDDVEADDSTFLKEMLKRASLPHVGAVGVKLLYPDWESIQHIGVTDINAGPTHKLSHYNDRTIRYFGRNRYAWDVLAVTGACLMVNREKYFMAGGFRDTMKVGYNDVDLCIKLYENGLYNVVDCGITLIHHESVGRGYDAHDKDKMMRLMDERMQLYEAHPWLKGYGDPFYHRMLDADTTSYGPRVVAQYQLTDYRNECVIVQKLPARESEKISLNIEKCSYEHGISPGVCDAYVFEGWSLINKADNSQYLRRFYLAPEDDEERFIGNEFIECRVSAKYREDVQQVFPDAINAELAGFVCRIPADMLQPGVTYRLAMGETTGSVFHNYLTLGDKFEIERGIIKDE